MNFLMLRGEVPRDRNPQEIVFDRLEDVDDTWTQLFYGLLGEDDRGELWYWGGKRKKKFTPNFIERWVPSFDTYRDDFVPDVIFCRGGFPQYHSVLKRFPNAIKVYYGAGRRFLPIKGFKDYDLLLVDSPTQLKIAREVHPEIKSTVFIKPAPDNLFYPIEGVEKRFDICFPACGRTTRKGHDFVYSTIPSHLKTLNLGFPSPKVSPPSNVVSKRVLKDKIPKLMQKCKVGIIASVKGQGLRGLSWDSCPRTIPELLACGLPIVVLDELEFWVDKYITPMTGRLADRDNYWEVVQDVLDNVDKYDPRTYYENNLTINHAAEFLRERIKEVQ